ncbi:hypothetical protein [Streptomyces sp. NPDC059783]|uniref:hypothetical protein n=1 Tax=Streptomyces sp. NPDC059783 TaxID=3346944 RepID=UPI0036688AB8
MTAQNPAMHARVAADALDRLIRDVQSGRARWEHQSVRQGADDVARITAAAAAVLQQLAAAYGQQHPGPASARTLAALHQAGQHTTTAADLARQARRTMN